MSIAHGTPIIGNSASMRRLRETIARVAGTRLAVLITGETGVGKELVAAALHRESGRRGAFVAVNVCAPTEGMFADAMFGHVRGAFTGALHDHAGHLREADGGTLFLDEIGSLPLDAQARLLRAIETRRFRPVGGRRDVESDFRVLSASNVELDDLVARGEFRADLAFRLRGFEIRVPALRERMEDLPGLVAHLLGIGWAGARAPVLGEGALRPLFEHHWPGNVRELAQVVGRAVAFAGEPGVVCAEVLREALSGGRGARANRGVRAGRSVAPPVVEAHSLPRRKLIEALQRHEWRTERVAAELGVSRKTVYARMQRCGIRPLRIHRSHGESTDVAGESPHEARVIRAVNR